MGCGQSLQSTPEVVETEPEARLYKPRRRSTYSEGCHTAEHSAKDNATYGTKVCSKKDEVETIRGSAQVTQNAKSTRKVTRTPRTSVKVTRPPRTSVKVTRTPRTSVKINQINHPLPANQPNQSRGPCRCSHIRGVLQGVCNSCQINQIQQNSTSETYSSHRAAELLACVAEPGMLSRTLTIDDTQKQEMLQRCSTSSFYGDVQSPDSNSDSDDGEANFLVRRTRSFVPEDVEKFYQFLDQIGQGQYATVFKARNRNSGEVVAVKLIDRKDTGVDVLSVTDKEIQAMKAVDHPNCVSLCEIFQTEFQVSYASCMHNTNATSVQVQLVMELAQGEDLFARLLTRSPKRFPEHKGLEIMQQICAGVRHLHHRRIIHRDLKPENILLASKDIESTDVKVADFGLSKLFPDDSAAAETQTRCGTPGYVAPEVLKRKKYSYKIDSWSCGVIAYIVLCGYPPFPLDMKEKTLKRVYKGDFRFPSQHWKNISHEAKDFIRQVLH